MLPIAFGVLERSDRRLAELLHGCCSRSSAVALVWMHLVDPRRWRRASAARQLEKLPELPEMQEIHEPKHVGVLGRHLHRGLAAGGQGSSGTRPGARSPGATCWISIPALLLSFAVWMVWSVVVAKLPAIGFTYTTDQLFWLAALPGLSGATLRIFYSFMVPIFGGRLWTTLDHLVADDPGARHRLSRCRTRTRRIWLFLALALLCGFGGGNFASSMSNISFFFPKAEKGNALALNAGLGNLGVSVVQFVVPLVITVGVFGWLGGEPVDGQGAGEARRSGCRTPASSGCRSSSPAPSRPGSA